MVDDKNDIVILEEKLPPTENIYSKQLDLFGLFITNDENKVSNTIEFWDSIPKYFLNSKQQEKLRTREGLASPYIKEYMKDGVHYKVVIQPALIEQKDKSFKAFFPNVTEELIEEVLKKFLTDQQKYGVHIEKNNETWVRFSLNMIHKELKEHNKTRSFDQIKQSINIMSSSILILNKNKKEIWRGAILQDLVTVDREKYIEDNKSLHIARLPLFISHAINQLDYRQFNYNKLMSSTNQLTRYIYKRLINRFVNANYFNNYHFMYSDIKQGCGLLQAEKEIHNREKIKLAFKELEEQRIITKYEIEEKKEGKKIIDVKYIVIPSTDFVHEQKAANKRKNIIEDK